MLWRNIFLFKYDTLSSTFCPHSQTEWHLLPHVHLCVVVGQNWWWEALGLEFFFVVVFCVGGGTIEPAKWAHEDSNVIWAQARHGYLKGRGCRRAERTAGDTWTITGLNSELTSGTMGLHSVEELVRPAPTCQLHTTSETRMIYFKLRVT